MPNVKYFLSGNHITLRTDGELRWRTFAGGVANTILAQQLKSWGESKADKVSVTIEGEPLIDQVQVYLGSLIPQEIPPEPDPRAIENLKFSEALPRSLAEMVFCRCNDEEVIRSFLASRSDTVWPEARKCAAAC